MSGELLPCPFCRVIPEASPASEFLFHPDNGCWLSNMSCLPKLWNTRTPPSGVELKECSHGLKRHYGCSDNKPPSGGETIRSMEEYQRKYFPSLVGKECPSCGEPIKVKEPKYEGPK